MEEEDKEEDKVEEVDAEKKEVWNAEK